MEAFRVPSRSPSIMCKMCCRKSKIHPALHGENVLTHILFTPVLCDKLQYANGGASSFLGGPGSYEYRLFRSGGHSLYSTLR